MLLVLFIYSVLWCVCVLTWGGGVCVQTYIYCWSLAGCEVRRSVQRCLFQRSGDWESPNTHLFFICVCVVWLCVHACWGGGGDVCKHTYMSTYIAVLIICGLWGQTLSTEEPFLKEWWLGTSYCHSLYFLGVCGVVCACVGVVQYVCVWVYCVCACVGVVQYACVWVYCVCACVGVVQYACVWVYCVCACVGVLQYVCVWVYCVCACVSGEVYECNDANT